MLNKKDLEQIEQLIQKNLKKGLQEFFETFILPYFEHNEKDHAEIKETLRGHDKQLKENASDHERIFRSLERNRDEHDEMFKKLDSIEHHVKNHEKRVKRLEAIAAD